VSAGLGRLSGGDPGADLGTAQRRDGLGWLTAFGQLIEQLGSTGRHRLDRGLEGIVLCAGGIAQSGDLSNVLPCGSCIQSSVASGSNPRNSVMLRHMPRPSSTVLDRTSATAPMQTRTSHHFSCAQAE
jgi:hypothetical protein